MKSHSCQEREYKKTEQRAREQSFENAFIDQEEKGQAENETKEYQRDRRVKG